MTEQERKAKVKAIHDAKVKVQVEARKRKKEAEAKRKETRAKRVRVKAIVVSEEDAFVLKDVKTGEVFKRWEKPKPKTENTSEVKNAPQVP